MSEKTFTQPTDGKEVRWHYNENVEHEWQRLELDAYHQLEWLQTMLLLRTHLPANGLVLDAGGGPGRYARELCRAGHQVVLFDLAPGLLAKAQAVFADEPAEVRENLRQCVEGDIRDLSAFPTESFAATLCLGGPLSHIHDADERRQAVVDLAGHILYVGRKES
ncbi:MAG TPA: class I SAM-dependent methyltransferase [Armatimonadota bacterium]|jgi:SAM-dependent methyltransferase